MILSHIVATGEQKEIGLNGKMLWHIPKDFKNFKTITLNHHILMGRKTFQSIGKPLVSRKNIIISRNTQLSIEEAVVFNDLNLAIEHARENGENELFIIGGAEIYNLTLPLVSKVYLSKVEGRYNADSFYNCDLSSFKVISNIDFEKENKAPAWSFQILKRTEVN